MGHEIKYICTSFCCLYYLWIHDNIYDFTWCSFYIIRGLLLSLSYLTLPIDMGILNPDWFYKSTKTFYSGWSTPGCLTTFTKIFYPEFLSNNLITIPESGWITRPPYSSKYRSIVPSWTWESYYLVVIGCWTTLFFDLPCILVSYYWYFFMISGLDLRNSKSCSCWLAY